MTQSAALRQAVASVQSAFPSGGGDWSRKRFEEWVKAVEDLDAESVHSAARSLIREWADEHGRAPQPGHLRSRALGHMRRLQLDGTRAANGCRFVEAHPDPRDPAGTVRYIVIQPDGSRIPAGARIAGEQQSLPRERGVETGAPFPRGPLNGGS